ncbi:MAG TPA: hypothetical protein DCM57_05760 [Treponema sp.]|nr:hypothetical protein [Treponema sp.]
MKSTYTIIFTCMALIQAICVYITKKSKRKIAPDWILPASISLIPTLANVAITLSQSTQVCNWAYAVFYASLTWLLLIMAYFFAKFTAYEKIPKQVKIVLTALAAIDSLSMLLNPILGHAYQCYGSLNQYQEVCIVTRGLLGFKIHLILSYLLSILSFAILIRKICISPSVYWRKYLTAIGSLFAVILWDALFVLKKTVIDTSIIGYAIACAMITYFAIISKPHILINSLLGKVAAYTSNMIVFFDIDGICVYANEPAKKFLGINDGSLDKCKELLEEITGQKIEVEKNENYTKTIATNKNPVAHLQVEYRTIFHNKKTEGVFFQMQDATESVNRYRKEKYLATHDPLTGIYNRETLFKNAEEKIHAAPETSFYVLAIDVKNFTLLNDMFGRETGDTVLKKMAFLFPSKKLPNVLYGRLEGDKFGMVLSKEDFESNVAELRHIGWQIGTLLRKRHYSVTLLIGIYRTGENDISIPTMFDRALIAIDSIKNSGDAKIAYYDEEMRQEMVWEQQIVTEFSNAIASRQFEIYLQPQADREGRIVGAEALARWNHPQKGLIPPIHFIPVLEKNGLISKLDFYVWEQTCIILQKLKRMDKNDFYISVNISPKDFYYTDVAQSLIDLVAKYEIDCKNLRLEITESVISTDLEMKLPLLDRLQVLGFIVEMDDFGSGNSSLNMLKDIRVDVLKLDMGFLYRAKDLERSRIIIKQIILMARELGIQVVTEGVETQAQADFLRSVGCDVFQGYYFGKPVPLEKFFSQMLP